MSLFIETIRIENGRIHNLSYHNRRMNETRRNVLCQTDVLDLNDYIRPVNYRERTKCRVEYDVDIRNVEYAAYHFRPVSSLRLVVDDEADYRYKSRDRSVLNRLFACRETEDDVLVVRKGLLTDTSICNVAFWNRKQWITPSAPLLAGTKRASLLDQGELVAGDIRPEDLPGYSRIRLFNAMIEFGKSIFRLIRSCFDSDTPCRWHRCRVRSVLDGVNDRLGKRRG